MSLPVKKDCFKHFCTQNLWIKDIFYLVRNVLKSIYHNQESGKKISGEKPPTFRKAVSSTAVDGNVHVGKREMGGEKEKRKVMWGAQKKISPRGPEFLVTPLVLMCIIINYFIFIFIIMFYCFSQFMIFQKYQNLQLLTLSTSSWRWHQRGCLFTQFIQTTIRWT